MSARSQALLPALQGGLEGLYRVSTELDVRDFLIAPDARAGHAPTRAPAEQLLVREGPAREDLELGLYLDDATLERLADHDPRCRLDDENLGDFVLALEGVSHFVYLACRARDERPLSAIELELQAEVDKWAVTLLVQWDQRGEPPAGLRARLFRDVSYLPDLSDEERQRYTLANEAANDYAASLEARFVRRRAVDELRVELRRFYQQGLYGKLDRIGRAA